MVIMLTYWPNIFLQVFEDHQQKRYHINALANKEEFLMNIDKPQRSIENRIDAARAEAVQANRRKITPIVEAVITMGRQELAFRGHRDSGAILIDDGFVAPNKGNFKSLLAYRAIGDASLREFLEGPGDKYTSPKIQNEVIEACFDILTAKVIQKVKETQFFSVLVDETTDVSNQEQVRRAFFYLKFTIF